MWTRGEEEEQSESKTTPWLKEVVCEEDDDRLRTRLIFRVNEMTACMDSQSACNRAHACMQTVEARRVACADTPLKKRTRLYISRGRHIPPPRVSNHRPSLPPQSKQATATRATLHDGGHKAHLTPCAHTRKRLLPDRESGSNCVNEKLACARIFRKFSPSTDHQEQIAGQLTRIEHTSNKTHRRNNAQTKYIIHPDTQLHTTDQGMAWWASDLNTWPMWHHIPLLDCVWLDPKLDEEVGQGAEERKAVQKAMLHAPHTQKSANLDE
eukprot:4192631-Pleurochrysis_carterae.AAC.3